MRNLILVVFKYLTFLFAAFLLLSLLWVAVYKFINPPVSTMMIYKYFLSEKRIIHHKWVTIEEINPNVPIAFIASEDQLFLKHNGFDIVAIKSAIAKNQEGNRLVGASTISQQVAKNVFLIPNKTFVRKALEAYFTLLIEGIWGKKRIMEVYLNVVELGEGVYGVESASNLYYQSSAKQLNQSQACLFAVALPNPIRYSIQQPSNYMIKRSHWVQRQVRNLGGTILIKDWYD